MLRGSCFPSSHSSMLLPHLQLWGSLQQHRVKWPQQYPNKAELKRDVSPLESRKEIWGARRFLLISTCCVCLSPRADWRDGGNAARGRREPATAQTRLPSAWEVTELPWKKSCTSYRWKRTHQKLCLDGKVWPPLSRALSSCFCLPARMRKANLSRLKTKGKPVCWFISSSASCWNPYTV